MHVGYKHAGLILQFATALHAQELDLKTAILLFDEPETSLHAKALVSALSTIVRNNDDGQVWIATHSVPLISSLMSQFAKHIGLYFMDHGALSYAGRKPELVLTSLLGGEENIDALRRFISLPVQHAMSNFASECLQAPDVVAVAGESDPQMQIIRGRIEGLRDHEPLRILDFGAGKGRLLDSLAHADPDTTPTKLDYYAFDCCATDEDACESVIQRVYGSGTKRWFNTRDDLFGTIDPASAQLVVACNVVHEIDPLEWISTFDGASVISQAIRLEGFMLVVEDYLMPIGEHAHQFGFVVLGGEALQALFKTCKSEGLGTVHAQGSYTERIRGHLIPAKALSRISTDTRTDALTICKRIANEKIKELRKIGDTTTYGDGLKFGYWTQQYANASLALEALS